MSEICTCEQCVNHSEFVEGWGKGGDWNDHALCYVYGIDTCRSSRGCDYWETNPRLARDPENTPKVPSVGCFGSLLKYNSHDFSTKMFKCIVHTGEVYGRWYAGHSFGVHTGHMYGSGSMPNIHHNSHATEHDAIMDELRVLLWGAEHNCPDMPEVAQEIKQIIMNNRQLTLFD